VEIPHVGFKEINMIQVPMGQKIAG
jgi:hypothetical protein